jgi:hypothetical protein
MKMNIYYIHVILLLECNLWQSTGCYRLALCLARWLYERNYIMPGHLASYWINVRCIWNRLRSAFEVCTKFLFTHIDIHVTYRWLNRPYWNPCGIYARRRGRTLIIRLPRDTACSRCSRERIRESWKFHRCSPRDLTRSRQQSAIETDLTRARIPIRDTWRRDLQRDVASDSDDARWCTRKVAATCISSKRESKRVSR